MPINARCPNAECGKALKLKDELAGKKVKCPACASVFVVPAGDGDEIPPTQLAAKKKPAPVARNDDQEAADREDREVAGAAPKPVVGTGLDKQTEMIMYGGLGALAVLVVSVFLPWIPSLAGTNFTPGIILLILALGAAGAVGALFAMKKPVAPSLLGGGAVGAYAIGFWLIYLFKGFSGVAAIGYWIVVLGGLGAVGTFVLCSLRSPYRLPALDKQGTAPFLRDYGTLGGALAIGLILGIIFGLIGTSAGGSTTVIIQK